MSGGYCGAGTCMVSLRDTALGAEDVAERLF